MSREVEVVEVRVSDVKKWAGREEAFTVTEAWPLDAHQRIDLTLADPAQVQVLVRNTGGGSLVVQIAGEVEVQTVCSRCAEPFGMTLPFEATEEFRDEPGPDDENLDYSRYVGDVVGLDKLVADAVGLSVPIAPVCRPDCQGLCVICGANRNLVQCGCEPTVDDRWAALRQYQPDSSEHEKLERENNGRTEA